jgi:hypothetical protein
MLQERVEKAGGQVLYWNGHRVMGVLAMSRAIGDHCLRPYVIPEPEVRNTPLMSVKIELEPKAINSHLPSQETHTDSKL